MRIFVQGEDIIGIQVTESDQPLTGRHVVLEAVKFGFPAGDDLSVIWVGLEDSEKRLLLEEVVSVGDSDVRVHCHRCREITVTGHYNSKAISKTLPPGTTIGRVKEWLTSRDSFDIAPIDAADLVLVPCDDDADPLVENGHIGSLVHHPNCSLCVSLVPADRHQG